tara:strand:- start:7677 stop:10355 length:2679 start_codon:yes stop_codon:yes gene_type:complete
MNLLDIVIITFFLLFICLFGVYQSYSNKSQKDFFLAGRDISWITAMFSIVATETSVLTFISVPAIAYRGDWTFLQLSIGYIIGRFLVSFLLIPLYFKHGIMSIYEILEKSFGSSVQKLASATFLITRVLADGVRFAAIAIVIQAITGWSIPLSILLVGAITLLYTVLGGLKAVIKIDALQFIVYLISAVICIYYLFESIDLTFIESFTYLNENNKFKIFDFTSNIIYKPFAFLSSIIGGAMLSFASHGVDYMMVQRVLATKNILSARKAMIGSGIFVLLQFSLFLFVGSLLYIATDCMILDKNQEISYIIHNILPNGMKGIVVAGILSVAMSTLSSSINSLSSSTINDWFPKLNSIRNSQVVSLFWTIILIFTALYFSDPNDPLIIIGLKIASFTYGSLLSLFLLSKFIKNVNNEIVFIGFISGIIIVFYFMKFDIAWTYYILGSVIINFLVVFLLKIINHFFIRVIMIIIILLSVIPLFSNENQSQAITQILDYNVKQVCYSDSILYGYDVMLTHHDKFKDILNVGIIVNHTSSIVNIDKINKNIEINVGNSHIYVKKIFTPEHGLNNDYQAGEKIMGDMSYNIPIVSLYGESFKPRYDELKDLDALIFDIQDIGSRYYTYISTLTNIMDVCSEFDLPLYILDRPNPVGGDISGPILDMKYSSFVGMHPIPIVHGMTIGEVAYMINELGWVSGPVDLKIVKMKGWNRQMNFENTGKKWIAPSPNIANNNTAFIYQGTCLIEGTNLSEGRGTDKPFFYIGAPWLNSKKLLIELNKLNLEGVDFYNKVFTPRTILGKVSNPKFEYQQCNGIGINIKDRKKASPLLIAVHIIDIVNRMHPNEFRFNSDNFIDKLYGSNHLRKIILSNGDIDSLFKKWENDQLIFEKKREPFLLY